MYANIMRLAKDPILNNVQVKGEMRSVLNNRVAIGQGAEKVTFIDVTIWGKLAELVVTYLKKGDEFYAEGELFNGTYPLKIEGMTAEKKIQTVYLQINAIRFTHGKTLEKGKPATTEGVESED